MALNKLDSSASTCITTTSSPRPLQPRHLANLPEDCVGFEHQGRYLDYQFTFLLAKTCEHCGGGETLRRVPVADDLRDRQLCLIFGTRHFTAHAYFEWNAFHEGHLPLRAKSQRNRLQEGVRPSLAGSPGQNAGAIAVASGRTDPKTLKS